jgi:hypothetical protein
MVDAKAKSLTFFGREYPVREVGRLRDGKLIKRIYVLHHGGAHALVVREGVRPHGKAYRSAREVTGPEAMEATIDDGGVQRLVEAVALRGLGRLNETVERQGRLLAHFRGGGIVIADTRAVGEDERTVIARKVQSAYLSLYQKRERLRALLDERAGSSELDQLPVLLTSRPLPAPTERVYSTKVAGVTGKNHDGTDRQHLIAAACMKHGRRPRLPLALIREPDNPHDPNAVAVAHGDIGILGHVPKELAAKLSPDIDAGCEVNAVMTSINGGDQPGHHYGLRIKITLGPQ